MPEKCPLSFNPYTYCPIMFNHEDEMILSMVTMLVADIKRILFQTLPMNGEDAMMIYRATREITAYMNGRIHDLVKMIPKSALGEDDGPGQPV